MKIKSVFWVFVIIPCNALITAGAVSSFTLMLTGILDRTDSGEAGKAILLLILVAVMFIFLLALFQAFVPFRSKEPSGTCVWGVPVSERISRAGVIVSFILTLVALVFMYRGAFVKYLDSGLQFEALPSILLFDLVPVLLLLLQVRLLWKRVRVCSGSCNG